MWFKNQKTNISWINVYNKCLSLQYLYTKYCSTKAHRNLQNLLSFSHLLKNKQKVFFVCVMQYCLKGTSTKVKPSGKTALGFLEKLIYRAVIWLLFFLIKPSLVQSFYPSLTRLTLEGGRGSPTSIIDNKSLFKRSIDCHHIWNIYD